MEKVHRLGGSGWRQSLCLRYSRALEETRGVSYMQIGLIGGWSLPEKQVVQINILVKSIYMNKPAILSIPSKNAHVDRPASLVAPKI